MTTKASPPLTSLSEAQRTQALERFALLRPALPTGCATRILPEQERATHASWPSDMVAHHASLSLLDKECCLNYTSPMIQQHIFQSQDLPEQFKCQILSFMRVEWFEGFQGKNRLRDWITRLDMHPVNCILEEEGILISHLEVVWKLLPHAGKEYKAYGVTGVFTYPAFRRQGYGLHLLQVAKDYIQRQGDADIVIFHSGVQGFYEKAGFEPMKNMLTLVGDPQNPRRSHETGFMLFLSEKGKASREQFENGTLYFGDETW